MMDGFALLAIAAFGVYLMVKAARRPLPAGRGKWLVVAGKSFLAVIGGSLSFFVCGAMISLGLGLCIFFTALLFVLLFILEGAGVNPGYASIARVSAFPIILVGMMAFSARRHHPSELAIPTQEYSERSPIDVDAWEQPTHPAHRDRDPGLRITRDFPKIEGSTSLQALYLALAQTLYVGSKAENHVLASKTPVAYANLIEGKCDLVFAFYPSDEQLRQAEEAGVPLQLTPVGREAFVFFVNPENPVSDLPRSALRDIYAGRVTNWREVGGADETITAFQRQKNSGSQSRMERFMAGDALATPPKETRIWDMVGIVSMVARYHNYSHAIGYSFLYFMENMVAEHKVKILRVDGVSPSLDSISDGSYPLVDDIYAVTTAKSNPNVKPVVDWLLSPRGQRLVQANGYAPIAPTTEDDTPPAAP